MSGAVMVETERLVLREFTEDDAEAMYALGSNPLVMRYMHDPMRRDVEHAREVLRAYPLTDYRKYGFGRWACVLRADGRVIGFIGLKYLDDLRDVDIGYRLLPDCWGAGLATEGSAACIRYGLERLGLRRTIGLVDPENVASVRVLEKCGLKPDGFTDFRGLRAARYVIEAVRWTTNRGPACG